MKKLLQITGWLSGAIGLVLIILGIIAVLAGGILFNHYWSNYFYPAGVFLLFGIFVFMGDYLYCHKAE